MLRALKEYQMEGIQTNLAFFGEILNRCGLQKGKLRYRLHCALARREERASYPIEHRVGPGGNCSRSLRFPPGWRPRNNSRNEISVEDRSTTARPAPMMHRTAIIDGERIEVTWSVAESVLEATVNGRTYKLEFRQVGAGAYWFGWNGLSIQALVTPRGSGILRLHRRESYSRRVPGIGEEIAPTWRGFRRSHRSSCSNAGQDCANSVCRG